MLFYATFTTGLHEPVALLAKRAGLVVKRLLDGALVYESPTAKYLPCFANVYEIWAWRSARDSNALNAYMKEAAQHPERFGLTQYEKKRQPPGGKRGFRIVVSAENRLVSADANLKRRLEQHIAAHTGLTPDRGGAGEEFWFLYRREGAVFFLRRLTTHTAYEKTLHKGELRPELAYLLNALPDVPSGGVVLDPFCGYGAIPAARRRYFADSVLYAADIDSERVQATRAALARAKPRTTTGGPRPPRNPAAIGSPTRVEVRQAGIDRLSSWLPAHSVDAIVTDPPWGLYDGSDVRLLYEVMLTNFLPVVRSGGIMVVLTSQKTLLRELLSWEKHRALVLAQYYDILVSGKKAGVFVLKRV